MQTQKSRLVIFDFFGVFCTDFVMGWLESRGWTDRAAGLIREHVHPADLGHISFDEQCQGFGRDLGVDWRDVKAELLSFAHFDREVVEIAHDVARVAPLALCSNAPRGVVEDVLDRAGVTLPFGVRVISGDVALMKPDREIYQCVLDRASVPARQAVMIDDRRVNVEAAEAIGMTGIEFISAAQLRSRLHHMRLLP